MCLRLEVSFDHVLFEFSSKEHVLSSNYFPMLSVCWEWRRCGHVKKTRQTIDLLIYFNKYMVGYKIYTWAVVLSSFLEILDD